MCVCVCVNDYIFFFDCVVIDDSYCETISDYDDSYDVNTKSDDSIVFDHTSATSMFLRYKCVYH